jgi:hypothetical protein
MLTAPSLAPKFAIALDPAFIRAAAQRAGSLKLQRRTCRPLETRASLALQVEFAEFDEQIDLKPIQDESPFEGDDIIAAMRAAELAAPADEEEDEF